MSVLLAAARKLISSADTETANRKQLTEVRFRQAKNAVHEPDLQQAVTEIFCPILNEGQAHSFTEAAGANQISTTLRAVNMRVILAVGVCDAPEIEWRGGCWTLIVSGAAIGKSMI